MSWQIVKIIAVVFIIKGGVGFPHQGGLQCISLAI